MEGRYDRMEWNGIRWLGGGVEKGGILSKSIKKKKVIIKLLKNKNENENENRNKKRKNNLLQIY